MGNRNKDGTRKRGYISVSTETFDRFRAKCDRQNVSMGHRLDEIIRQYLDSLESLQ